MKFEMKKNMMMMAAERERERERETREQYRQQNCKNTEHPQFKKMIGHVGYGSSPSSLVSGLWSSSYNL